MPDNTNNRGQRDRGRVAENQPYELSYLEEKLNVTREEIREAIKQVGNDRNKVEEFLSSKNQKGGR